MDQKSLISKRVLYLVITLMVMLPMLAAASEKPPNAIGTTLYVDPDATGPEDGITWGTAYHHLQDALDRTNANGSSLFMIWVAEGVYYPDEESIGAEHSNDVQSESFMILYDNVRLYGGFAGGETSTNQRDWVSNPTILSGDIDKNDTHGGDFINDDWYDISGNNAYHVIELNGAMYEGITTDTLIDGFIITAGDGSSLGQWGGGIYCKPNHGGSSGECSPRLRNLIVQGNRAGYGGGIVFDAQDSSVCNPEITNVSLIGNRATSAGGGMSVISISSPGPVCNPALVNVKFRGNYAGTHGGGFSLLVSIGTGSPTLTNVEFYDNGADSNGGGYYSNTSSNGISEQVLTNVTFHSNYAENGGGMFNMIDTFTTYSIYLNNVILWGDSATSHPEMMNDYFPVISNSDIQGCGGSASWVSACGTDNGGNIDADPLFANPGTGDLTLQLGSPAIHAGDQTLLPADVTDVDRDLNTTEIIEYDLAMNPRVQSYNVDMGAYEMDVPVGDRIGMYSPPQRTWYLKNDNDDGWANVQTVRFGSADTSWVPVGGDWFNVGFNTIGMYSPPQKTWYLKSVNSDGWGDITTVRFGSTDTSWVPVVGDWDGNGTDTIGMYRPDQKSWYLKDAHTDGWGDVTTVRFGSTDTSWVPVVGDWDGDGADEIGMYSPPQKTWYLKNANTDGWGDISTVRFGSTDTSWVPMSGDWDFDGTDTIGMYRPDQKSWYLKIANDDGWANVHTVRFGSTDTSWAPVVGKWLFIP